MTNSAAAKLERADSSSPLHQEGKRRALMNWDSSLRWAAERSLSPSLHSRCRLPSQLYAMKTCASTLQNSTQRRPGAQVSAARPLATDLRHRAANTLLTVFAACGQGSGKRERTRTLHAQSFCRQRHGSISESFTLDTSSQPIILAAPSRCSELNSSKATVIGSLVKNFSVTLQPLSRR
jgi:hypothetical protein